MCIRDRLHTVVGAGKAEGAMDAGNMLKPALARGELHCIGCLLYTSDAADELLCVDLGGRRIIKKKTSVIRNYCLSRKLRRVCKSDLTTLGSPHELM